VQSFNNLLQGGPRSLIFIDFSSYWNVFWVGHTMEKAELWPWCLYSFTLDKFSCSELHYIQAHLNIQTNLIYIY